MKMILGTTPDVAVAAKKQFLPEKYHEKALKSTHIFFVGVGLNVLP